MIINSVYRYCKRILRPNNLKQLNYENIASKTFYTLSRHKNHKMIKRINSNPFLYNNIILISINNDEIKLLVIYI